jgi:predicted DNA-binding protein with PD1-like motif
MVIKEFHTKRLYQGSLDKGVEIVNGLFSFMKQHAIRSGVMSGIGAVSEAELGYFNAGTKAYEKVRFKENLEIVSLRGNISRKDNEVFPHLHAVLSKRDFSAIGGHLFSGIVYAFEFEILPFEETPFTRKFDEATGLFLWNKEETA